MFSLYFRSALFSVFAVFFSLHVVEAAPRKPSVIVKVSDVSHVDRLTKKFNWRVKQTVTTGRSAIFVIEDVSEGQLKQLLKTEAGVLFVEENKVITMDGGETVLPLDGGETVLPLINMSFGTTTPSAILQDAVSYAQSLGVTLVAAGGNSNTEPLMYPARYLGVDGVVAVTNSDLKASFSNYGTAALFQRPAMVCGRRNRITRSPTSPAHPMLLRSSLPKPRWSSTRINVRFEANQVRIS
jgi:hypothetical protein